VDAICIVVAGVVAATLPGPGFTLAWTHSVAQTRWEEHYRVEGDALRLVEAAVAGSGAGMEPPPDAVLSEGRWRWHPDRMLAQLALANTAYAADYTLCTASGCRKLGEIAGPSAPGQAVVIRPCRTPAR
jgi:hypothetical protein